MTAPNPWILVVDDEADICCNLADIFSELGYRIDTALDGRSALELVRKHRYDIALLDLMMPDMDGVSLYFEMRKIQPGIVALLVTAHPGHPRAEAAMGAGLWRLLPKPIEFSQLIALIDVAVGQPLVLVVDDDADFCTNLWDLLREYGYRVCMAHDVASAVRHIDEMEFKVILLDLRLPDGDGDQVFRAAYEINPDVNVIIITGCEVQREQRIQQEMPEGARRVLRKPLDIPNLLAILHQFAGGRPPGRSW